jgi:D-alanyl-D-alanine carboxypeptidase (penicillin-binding protein 5/6)
VLCAGAVGLLPGVAAAVTPTPNPPSPHDTPHTGSARSGSTHPGSAHPGSTHSGSGHGTRHTARPGSGSTDSADAGPAGAGCVVANAPPAPVDASEKPEPGAVPPSALPVPAQPVGGPRMGECGIILPTGAPSTPVGEDSVSWIIADLDSGAVLAAKDPHARERPASLLKVLTALVVLDKLDLNSVVLGTAQDANAPGSRVGVGPGGEYTVRQLLTGLILNSGNDAANALARQLGGVDSALGQMSAKAVSLGASDTRPASPSGLDSSGMSTSAYDLALFYRAAIQNPTFAEVSRTRLFDWPGRGSIPGFKISNDNHMLAEYPGTFGGKTGFTDDARHTRITAAERNGRRLVVVQMRGEQHPVSMDTQAARLLDYGFALPPDSPPVGQLVNGPPAPPSEAPQVLAGAAGPLTQTVAPEEPVRPAEHRLPALLTIGGGALLGALLSWLLVRRRPQPKGRHSTRAG